MSYFILFLFYFYCIFFSFLFIVFSFLFIFFSLYSDGELDACCITLSCVVLRGIAWCCAVLRDGCVMLRGATWCCVVLRGAACVCCVVLRGAAWCCVVLRGAAWCMKPGKNMELSRPVSVTTLTKKGTSNPSSHKDFS